jgi:pimeloyl-ACP methyl ester carboxylesterase
LNYDNRSVSIGPLELGYRIEGEGPLTVLLLHGLRSHSGTWRRIIPGLSKDATVVAPSLPSRMGDATPELAELYTLQVSAVCADSGVSRAVVVGNSMGGWVAMRLLTKHRNLVSAVVLEDTAGSGSEEARALERSRIPVLILWGESDTVLPVSLGRELHSRLSRSELRVIRGAGHVPHWETPEAFSGVLREFLGRHARLSTLSR